MPPKSIKAPAYRTSPELGKLLDALAGSPDPKKYLCTYDAAQALDMRRGTFLYRANKLGVRYVAGRRIWDGYSWLIEDIERIFNVKIKRQ